uniref:Uncharacterized protein n=1 Tax=Triticum urartu TaxID=4572 RepID=A0A8R7NYS1_TRIUA
VPATATSSARRWPRLRQIRPGSTGSGDLRPILGLTSVTGPCRRQSFVALPPCSSARQAHGRRTKPALAPLARVD